MTEKNQIKNYTVLNDVLEKSQENPEIPENHENNFTIIKQNIYKSIFKYKY